MPRLKIYRASAGSGKTFQLVREYLLIVLHEPEEYKHILGVTFTNKSTAEMKQRIIAELVRLSGGESSGHLQPLMDVLKLDERTLRNRARTALHFMLHDYSHVWISTIDSFFHRMIRSFARDIGLSAGYNLEMDTARVLDESVERLITELNKESVATRWVIDLALERVREGRNWNFRKELNDLGREVFKEKFQLREEEILRWVADQEQITAAYKNLSRIQSAFESALKQQGKKGLELMQSLGLTPDDFPYKASSFAAIFKKYADGQFDAPGSRAREAANRIEAWYAKNAGEPVKDKMQQAYHAGLNSLLVDMITYYDKEQRTYHTALACLEYFHQFVLISDIQQYIRNYRDENEVMLISDTASFISRVMGENEESFVFEKAGNYFHHYLIDEFQDTSQLQWNNFKPLLSNSISQDHVSMLVGDVKQSIYRFRNGDWRLLLYQAMEDIPYNQAINLSTNYRSDGLVVRFNNTVFDTLPGLMAEAYRQSFKDQEQSAKLAGQNMGFFLSAYASQRQDLPENKDKESGYVSVKFIAGDEEKKWKEVVLEQLPALLDDVLDRGFLPSGIALLVRDTNDAALVYDALIQARLEGRVRHTYDLLTERSLAIGSAPVVRLLVSAMYHLLDGRDKLRLAQLRLEYYAYLQQTQQEILHEIFSASAAPLSTDDAVARYLQRSAALRQLSLLDLVSELVQVFALDQHPMQISFLQSFQDVLLDYLRDKENSLSSFLDWWEGSGYKQTLASPENGNAVWIMTVHKSKGLEFPVVLLPFCDWPTDHLPFHTQILWTSLTEGPFGSLPLVPVKYTSRLEQTFFAQEYADEKMSAYLDNLNLLYVAFTRAVHELYIFAEQKKNPGTWRSVGDLLHTAIGLSTQAVHEHDLALAPHWNEEEAHLEIGERKIFSEPSRAGQSFQLQRFMQAPRRPALLFRREAALPEADDKVGWGNLVHEILFRMEHAGDAERVLQRCEAEGKLGPGMMEELRSVLHRILSIPEVKKWFDPAYTVWKERRMAVMEAGTQVPDRVVDTGTEIWVIDFKTGSKQANHDKQVAAYMDTLRQLYNRPVKGFLLYISLAEIKEVEA